MELNKNKFASAAALAMGAIYVICGVFVLLWPEFALQLFGWLVHLVNVDKFAGGVNVTAVGFAIGLLQVIIYTYIAAYLFAWLHNKFVK